MPPRLALSARARARRIPRSGFCARAYATHSQRKPSDLLSDALDQRGGVQRQGGGGLGRHDSVGPFQLGLVQPARGDGKPVKKWSELSAGGKVMRTTARTTNLGVILLGAGFSAMLVYALTSELFSSNSPTVLYGKACDKIKASPKVAKYLPGSLRFHNSPPSALRPRHRNRHVSSHLAVDSTGREHMLLNFYVEARPSSGAHAHADESYYDRADQWVRRRFSDARELTPDGVRSWGAERVARAREAGSKWFRYLSGTPMPPPSPLQTCEVETREEKADSGGWTSGLGGMFKSLKGVRGGPTEAERRADGKVWTEGEVHADFVRNDEGYFVFRYLFIDIPNSRGRTMPLRIFIEKGPGVREDEPTMHWDSS